MSPLSFGQELVAVYHTLVEEFRTWGDNEARNEFQGILEDLTRSNGIRKAQLLFPNLKIDDLTKSLAFVETVKRVPSLLVEDGQERHFFLSKAFEYFLSQIEESNRPSSFHKGTRKELGQFFTPSPLVKFVVQVCLEFWNGSNPSTKSINILDPSCGAGIFLAEVVNSLLRSDDSHEKLKARTIEGVDVSWQASLLSLANVNLTLEQSNPTSLTKVTVQVRDYLLEMPPNRWDLILGNPPYLGGKGFPKAVRRALEEKFKTIKGKADLFFAFLERAVSELREGGVLGFVLPRYWLESDFGRHLRSLVRETCKIRLIVDFRSIIVFEEAGVHSCILVLQKELQKKARDQNIVRGVVFRDIITEPLPLDHTLHLVQERIHEPNHQNDIFYTTHKKQIDLGNVWQFLPPAHERILSTIQEKSTHRLEEIVEIREGINTGSDRVTQRHIRNLGLTEPKVGEGIFVLTQEELGRLNLTSREISCVKPWLKGADVKRWVINPHKYSLLYFPNAVDPETIPNIIQHLSKYQKILENRAEIKRNPHRRWFELAWPRSPEVFENRESGRPKIMVPYKSKNSRAALDFGGHFASADFRILNVDPNYCPYVVAALLNSTVLEFYVKHTGKKMGNIVEYYSHTIRSLPLIYPSDSQILSKIRTVTMTIVDLKLNKGGDGKRVEELEEELDGLIFNLYGLKEGDKVVLDRHKLARET